MALDLTSVGKSSDPVERSWTSTDALLYAIAVGAGQGDPSQELEFTTENSSRPQRVLPCFICVSAGTGLPQGLTMDLTRLLHAEMGFELYGELKPEGRVHSVVTLDGIYDKGSGALVSFSTEVADAETGQPIAKIRSGLFVRGEGGFGGDRGPRDKWSLPDRDPDETLVYPTLKEQSLIYRLTGDRNPLHSDPVFAVKAGFPAPILHGMASYGFTARGLLHAVAGSDPACFGSMYGRFTKPVSLGETLSIKVWKHDGGAVFQTVNSAGDVVIDRGVVTTR